MEFLYQYIKNICIFSLVISLVLNIFPESSSKKYIKLFAGIEQIIKNYTHGSLKEENYTFENNRESLENKVYERVSNGYKENAGN